MRFYICKNTPFLGLPSGCPGCVVSGHYNAVSVAVSGALPAMPGVSSGRVLCGCPGGVPGRSWWGAASVPGCVPGGVVGAGCVVILCTRAGLQPRQVQVLTSRLNGSNDPNELNGSSWPNDLNDLNDSLLINISL